MGKRSIYRVADGGRLLEVVHDAADGEHDSGPHLFRVIRNASERGLLQHLISTMN